MIGEPGTLQAYEDDLDEAAAFKCIRNVAVLGGMASTAIYNYHEHLSIPDRAAITGISLTLVGLVAGIFERERRQSVRNSHIDAAIATSNARINGRPVPSWAKGNTGNIFRNMPEYSEESV